MDLSDKLTLKAARLLNDMSREEVAKAIGSSASTIANWENGKTSIPLDKAMELCKVYGVRLSDIKC